MDGIQFSFGIGAFPFAMMGGVSCHILFIGSKTNAYLCLLFSANVSNVWEQAAKRQVTPNIKIPLSYIPTWLKP